jgi:hypothetical protein
MVLLVMLAMVPALVQTVVLLVMPELVQLVQVRRKWAARSGLGGTFT